MKKLKHEGELFEATDSASDKALFICRLLVHDKDHRANAGNQVSEKTIRHRQSCNRWSL